MKLYLSLLTCLFLLFSNTQAYWRSFPLNFQSQSPSPFEHRTHEIYKKAFKNPLDEGSFQDLLKELPRDEDYYIVEGDLLMTEAELRQYIATKSETEKLIDADSKLVIGIQNEKYLTLEQRNLTYAVDKSSFPEPGMYERVVDNLGSAAKSWQAVCDNCQINFTHKSEYDENPSLDQVHFIVRYHKANGNYVVATFYPNQAPERRFINVDPSYFRTRLDREGIFRHGLGHILGYRHAQSGSQAGCYSDRKEWKPFTIEMMDSVMQPYCGYSSSIEFKINKSDILAHRKVYESAEQPTKNPITIGSDMPSSNKLIVLFEGGDASDNAAIVLSKLYEMKLLKVGNHKVKPGEDMRSIYRQYLNIPIAGNEMYKLAGALNNKSLKELSALKPSEEVKYPDVEFNDYTYSKRLEQNSTELANIRQYWKHVTIKEDVDEKGGQVRVYLTGFRLNLELASREQVAQLIQVLRDTERANLKWYSPADKSEKTKYFANPLVKDAKKFAKDFNRTEVPVGTQGGLGDLINLELPPCAKNCTAKCPRIVLIDKQVYLHPDIRPAIKEGGKADAVKEVGVHEGKYRFEVISDDDWKDDYHGTHLAGIIASQDDGVGLIGVHPSAQILSLDWDELNKDHIVFGERLEELESQGYNIYVLASEWTFSTVNDELKENDRLNDTLATKIKNLERLWITSAGDAKGGGVEIKKSSTKGPRNLGDFPMVIVVTACKDCDSANPQLLEDANYSIQSEDPTALLVHLAAPGDGIPSTVADGKYAVIPGTSQATAFVAGVASAMVSCYDVYRTKSYALKIRLQITARPFENLDRLASGILDAKLALLDPCKQWVKLNGIEHKPVEAIEWLRDTLIPQYGNPIKTGEVYRILNQNGQYWIYAKVKDDLTRRRPNPIPNTGTIKKIGPIRFSVETLNQDLFKTSDGQTLKLSQIEDLILSAPGGKPGFCN